MTEHEKQTRAGSESDAGTDCYEDVWVASSDGLRLYARDYCVLNPVLDDDSGAEAASIPLTILCLHGLTRNSADFSMLAERLRQRYRVVAMDQRGRGRSGYDAVPANYNLMTYVSDTWRLVEQLELKDLVLVGTSMGGLMSMLMASSQPEKVRGVVLNDVGPVVEAAGITRIQSYVGEGGNVASWADAARLARANNEVAFPSWDDDDWLHFARQLFVENDAGVPVLAYDPAISQPLDTDQSSAVPADLWPVFDGMVTTPTLVVRGALSDILSRETVGQMASRHAQLVSIEVPDRGHAPELNETEALQAITQFLAGIDNTR